MPEGGCRGAIVPLWGTIYITIRASNNKNGYKPVLARVCAISGCDSHITPQLNPYHHPVPPLRHSIRITCYNIQIITSEVYIMVSAIVPTGKEKPNTYGWLQFEKKATQELQKLAMKSPAAMGSLMYLVNNMSRSNALVVSQQAIANGIGAKRETVNRAIKYLVEHNFVQIVKAGGATVYIVNSRVAWQGNRGERYAYFGADIMAIESEQDKSTTIDDTTPLKRVPYLVEGERLLVGNEPIDPPDQQEMELP